MYPDDKLYYFDDNKNFKMTEISSSKYLVYLSSGYITL